MVRMNSREIVIPYHNFKELDPDAIIKALQGKTKAHRKAIRTALFKK
jgi:hypothetical protein